MKIERYINDNNDSHCFGFPHSLVGKSGVKEILSRLSGAEITYWSKYWGAEVFCEFKYKNKKFEVSEPYGDNSYYDILCKEPNTPELEEIYQLFLNTRVPTNRTYARTIALLAILAFLVVGLKIYGSR